MKQKEVAVVHYNTPELTEAAILSLRKHGGKDYHVTVFDNSDKRPFTKQMDGVTIIDNTRGQIIDFDKELEKFKNRAHNGTVNKFGSDRHMMSVQKLWDYLPEDFLLIDSDILLKQNVDFMWQPDECAVGHVQSSEKAGNRGGIDRLVPMLCYINVKNCRKCGIKYFDPARAWMLHSNDTSDKLNWYDTGASFLEDIRSHKNGARGKRIDIRPLMEHLQKGSWLHNGHADHQEWLKKHRRLWEPSPAMKGIKDIAICACGRQENRYAVEWVSHYKKLGVAKIFIYDNYFGAEEKLSDVLQKFVDSGFVELIDVHDRIDIQCKAYEHCYKLHGNEYAWIGFFDFDELLRYKGKQKLPDFMAQYTNGDVLLVNWRIMTDNGLTFYEDKPMAKRFTQPMLPLDKPVKYTRPENEHIKCFVRGGNYDVKFGLNPHCPDYPVMNCISPSGESIKQSAFAPIDHSVMWLDHYFTKTAEEWMHVKLSRGYHGNERRTANILSHQVERFFAINERTPEKEAILNGEEVARPVSKPKTKKSTKRKQK